MADRDRRRSSLGRIPLALVAASAAFAVAGATATPGRSDAAQRAATAPANGLSWGGEISANGRVVAFASAATNLVTGDTNRCYDDDAEKHYNCEDVFVRDRTTGKTTRVSVGGTGVQGNAASGLHGLAISADGRLVAFDSYASNLVAGDTTRCSELRDPGQGGGCSDVFVRDRRAGTTEQVDVSSAGTPAEEESHTLLDALSADGRYVVFESDASNLSADRYWCSWRYSDSWCHGVFVRDRVAGTTERVDVRLSCERDPSAPDVCVDGDSTAEYPANSYDGVISPNGRFVAFDSDSSKLVPGDTNDRSDVFVRDRLKSTTERVSIGNAGKQANGASGVPSISSDGRFVAFVSQASNLVAGDKNKALDVFVRDRVKGTTERISVSNRGRPANGGSFAVRIGANGRLVVFASAASNLVTGDTNKVNDVFVRDRAARTTVRVNVSSTGTPTQLNHHSYLAGISSDARYVAFDSDSSNLVRGDTNRRYDVFIRDRATKKTALVSVGKR